MLPRCAPIAAVSPNRQPPATTARPARNKKPSLRSSGAVQGQFASEAQSQIPIPATRGILPLRLQGRRFWQANTPCFVADFPAFLRCFSALEAANAEPLACIVGVTK